jgi:F-type H+-transporting ATPase subunit b
MIPLSRNTISRLALAAAAGLAAAPAFALPAFAAGGEGPATATDLILKGVNLAVLLGIIVYFARKPIARFFSGTAGQAKQTYDGTRQAAEETQAELEAQKRRIGDLENELGRMVQAAREDAESERRHLLAEAEAQAERIKAQARQQVEQEMNKARSLLRAQLGDETVRLAEEMIKSRIDDKRQKELLSDYLDEIGAGQ